MASSRILIVDDDNQSRQILKRILEPRGYECLEVSTGTEALEMLDEAVDLVLLDVNLPDLNGLRVTERVRASITTSDVAIIIVTGSGSRDDHLKALHAGADDFVLKPVHSVELEARVQAHLHLRAARQRLEGERSQLRTEVERKTLALRTVLESKIRAERNATEAHRDTVKRLAIASEYKDRHTAIHINRMSHYARILAQALGLPQAKVDLLRRASMLHDVGKLGIPDEILLKPTKLDADEWDIMKRHTVIGGRILHGSSSDLIRLGEVIALSHHEHWDGLGYPHGLEGERIPLEGRICAIADVFDALTSERPYKQAFSNELAFQIIEEERGRSFDPKLVDLFFGSKREVLEIQARYDPARDGAEWEEAAVPERGTAGLGE